MSSRAERNDFIRDIIDDDSRTGTHTRVATRFPPEPNGYLHIGHAKSICLNFGLAPTTAARATCASTTPTRRRRTSSTSRRSSATSAGSASSSATALFFASDYFERDVRARRAARHRGDAYVDRLTDEQIREYRGTLSEPGTPSARTATAPSTRTSTCSRRMRAGEFPDGAQRAAREDRHGVGEHEDARSAALPDPPRAPPPHRRRVVHLPDVRLRASARGRDRGHHALDLHARVREQPRALRLGARPHRAVGRRGRGTVRVRAAQPRLHGDEQAQAAALVEDGHVAGWDDPRMPTLAGMRRRGYRPEAIRAFVRPDRASRRPTPSSTSASSSSACATISTGTRRA